MEPPSQTMRITYYCKPNLPQHHRHLPELSRCGKLEAPRHRKGTIIGIDLGGWYWNHPNADDQSISPPVINKIIRSCGNSDVTATLNHYVDSTGAGEAGLDE